MEGCWRFTARDLTLDIDIWCSATPTARRRPMRGVPMPVIARQLGHADTRMTERHYAHLSPSYVAETIRASFPTPGIVEATNVKAMVIKA